MTRKASAETLLNRRLKHSDFPFVIRRKRWADIVTAVLSPVILGLSVLFLWFTVEVGNELGWHIVFPSLMAVLFIIGFYVLLDNIGYKLIVESDGVRAIGLLKTRHLSWSEITYFKTWWVRAMTDDGVIPLPFFQAVIHVDGSDDPKRLPRNLFFAGHFAPPFMELDGKDLVKLLAKAKQFAQSADGKPD